MPPKKRGRPSAADKAAAEAAAAAKAAASAGRKSGRGSKSASKEDDGDHVDDDGDEDDEEVERTRGRPPAGKKTAPSPKSAVGRRPGRGASVEEKKKPAVKGRGGGRGAAADKDATETPVPTPKKRGRPPTKKVASEEVRASITFRRTWLVPCSQPCGCTVHASARGVSQANSLNPKAASDPSSLLPRSTILL